MEKDLARCIDFHGHFCPGLAIGYRAAKIALARLNEVRAEDEELVAIVESDGCGIDAVQVVLSCTIGKGNLLYCDYGKQAYTVASRKTGQGIRLAMKGQCMPEGLDKEQAAAYILNTAPENIFKIETVKIDLPEEAKIFQSVTCEFCGEKVMEARARIRDGKIACLGCVEEYSRGW